MAKKTEDLKIKQEELDALQGKVQNINQMQMQIGILETNKSLFLQRISELQQELQALDADIQKTYGDVTVDIKTGIITPKVEENASNKKN
tara:strand:- start:409 stop:678 length:270 start_codon:yes stop_codon:yes gene_type:complete